MHRAHVSEFRRRAHVSDFMIDDRPLSEKSSKNLSDFVKNEPNYDIAFCRAWQFIRIPPAGAFLNSSNLLRFLDRIQECALSHLPEKKFFNPEKTLFQYLKGRSCPFNYFSLSKNLCSDAEGISDLIHKICVLKKNFELHCLLDADTARYILRRDTFCIHQEGVTTELYSSIDEEKLKEIRQKYLELYEKETECLEIDRIVILHPSSKEEREIEAIAAIDNYFLKRGEAISDIDKIRNIALLMRDLMQLHLYFDGNGRCIYILANALLHEEGLPLFYPKNMCIFDGNSVGKMVEEIISGQEVFRAMFVSREELTMGLELYSDRIQVLIKMLKEEFSAFPPLLRSLEERDLNLLFRQASQRKETLPLLEFLVENSGILGIDIRARGATSGTALDVATKFKNSEAIPILARAGL